MNKIISLIVLLLAIISQAGDSVPFLLNTINPLITAPITYNSTWVGGDSSAEVVISADGTEIKRTIGEGEFMWSPTTAGKHTLTYTTYINGVAQEEVYTATVFKDWKYTVTDGKATIVETAHTSGSVTIPSKIDGFLVVGLGDGLFNGCEGLTSVTISDSVTSVGKSAFDGCTGIRSVSLSPTFKIRNFNSGLIQAKFNSSDDFTSSIIDSESKSLVSGVLMGDAYDTESVTRTYTDPKYGGSHKWNSRYTTFGYAGYMYMIKDRIYVFGKYFDDSVLVRINGIDVLKNIDHTAFATGKYIPEKTGWHEIEVRVADGTGEKGPKGVASSGYWSGNLGVGWRDDGITDALPESDWNKMMDPGDGSLFRNSESLEDLTLKDLFPDSYDKLTSVTLTGDVSGLRNDAFEGCFSVVNVTLEPKFGDKVFPGFYEAEFRSMSSFDDTRSIIDNSRRIVLSADMLTADTTDELTMYGYAAQMFFEGGVEYGFLAYYDDKASVKIDGKTVIAAASTECRSQTYTIKYDESGWHDIELRGWNNKGGGAAYGTCEGIMWKKGSGAWQKFADPGDGSLFRTSGSRAKTLKDLFPDSYESIKNVTLTGTVTEFPMETFAGCTALESVKLDVNSLELQINGENGWYVDEEGLLRSAKIGLNADSSMMVSVNGAGRLSYRWKASSECYLDEIYDYGYLSVDGTAKGSLVDYKLNGIAIGGHTDWQEVELDISGSGSHSVRWVYAKDDYDDPASIGEDCVWVDDIRFRPLTTMGFVVGDATGVAPAPVVEISETKVNLPEYSGFNKAKYSLVGWSDGNAVYDPGSVFEMRATNATLSAVYEANTIAMPVIESSGVADGGVLDAASATISMSCDEGATIYYTLDGSTPTAASAKYAGEFEAFGLGEVTIKAVALRDNYFDSPVAVFTYTRKPYTLAECLNVGGWNVTSESPVWFRVQGEAAHDGNEALRSGAVGEGGASTVKLEVHGAGQLSFWVKTSSHMNRNRKTDYLSFKIDGTEYMWLGGSNDWTNVVCDITGSGAHTLTWTFTNNTDDVIYGENCAWLDEVMWMGGERFDITYANLKGATHQNPSSYYEGMIIKFSAPSTVDGYAFSGWTPSEITASDTGDKVVTANWEWTPQDAVVDASVTGWKPVTVKANWVKAELEQKFGVGKEEAFIAKFGDNLTSAMTKKTGKRDSDGKELLVWHDYVAGTDPTDINSTFKAIIEIQDGKPVISWEPDLNSNGEERVYMVHGKENLSDVWHTPFTVLDHFFKVDVAMLPEGTVIFNVGGGSTISPISIRVGQPIGDLPTPTRDGYTFLGWFTAQTGGTTVTPETIVTADMTIYARWEIEGLYATYLFDGDLCDSYDHRYDLSGESGSFVADRNGDADSAQYFDGNGKMVTTADCRVEAEFTFAFWCKTSVSMSENGSGDNLGSWSGNYILFPRNSQSDAGFGVKVGMDGISVMGHGDMYLQEQLGYSANIGTGWNHIAVSVSSDGTIGIYLNGVCVKTGMKPSSRKSVFVPEVGGGPYGYYTGCIDELLVFDKALDEDTIASIYRENIVFPDNPLYCVIDLSAGVNAVSYPVTYLSDVPAGGWTDEYKTTKLVLRRIEPGSFKMNGSYDVTLTKAFYCGVFEVTQKQYELVTGSKPSYFTGDKLPVEQVSWNAIRGNSNTYNWPTITTVDPDSFIGRIQARTGLNFDLPTEAQWEYACRAGTTTTYSYGDNANGEYMWNSNESASESHDVGTKLSNPWGLYDMHGNVWEWCLDWRGTLSGGIDPEGASSGWERINRGGGSSGGASYCTSAYRNYTGPEQGWLNVGFRLVGNLSE